jgi:hypothetical protein
VSRLWVTAVSALVVVIGALNTYHFAVNTGWVWAAVFGAALPCVALLEWWFLRRRSSDAALVADRMLVYVLWALFGLGSFAGAFDYGDHGVAPRSQSQE